MKHSKMIISIFLFLLLFILTGCSNENNNSTPQNTSSSASRTSTNTNLDNEENRVENLLKNPDTSTPPTEAEVASYSTIIKDKSSGRLTNIQITCSTLNGTILEPGETFSFCQTVGKPTAERGYQEASVIINHKTEKGIGGGNCQVSSTLYNAVLAVPGLKVTERHEHGKDVTYVPEGKDAAVSYGSLDLKFRNETGSRLRIDATTDNSSIVIKIIQLSK
ncbi:MAG: VanW family protein [Clostridia bacterium]